MNRRFRVEHLEEIYKVAITKVNEFDKKYFNEYGITNQSDASNKYPRRRVWNVIKQLCELELKDWYNKLNKGSSEFDYNKYINSLQNE